MGKRILSFILICWNDQYVLRITGITPNPSANGTYIAYAQIHRIVVQEEL